MTTISRDGVRRSRGAPETPVSWPAVVGLGLTGLLTGLATHRMLDDVLISLIAALLAVITVLSTLQAVRVGRRN